MDILIFDMDGVLVDASGSFTLATAATVRWCWENLLKGSVDCDRYTIEYFNIAKTHPALNDDINVSWLILRAMLRTGRKSMKEAFPSLEAWKNEVDALAADVSMEDLARENAQVPPLGEVRLVLEEMYFGTENYAKFKGKVRGIGGEGLWKDEKPGTSRDWKELGLPVGIYTGRTRNEVDLGYKILNWHGFPDNMLVCSSGRILKPSPEGLSILCERSGTKDPAFFGDTVSDLAAWDAFGRGSFIGIGPILKGESLRRGLPNFDTLEEALSSLLPS